MVYEFARTAITVSQTGWLKQSVYHPTVLEPRSLRSRWGQGSFSEAELKKKKNTDHQTLLEITIAKVSGRA